MMGERIHSKCLLGNLKKGEYLGDADIDESVI
jgi:hypothetical protein